MSKITLIVLFWRASDAYQFHTFFIPSILRFLCLDAIDSFIIIYRTPSRPGVNDPKLVGKMTYIPYSQIKTCRDKIKTEYVLCMSPNSFFFRPCFLEDLITPNGALLSQDDNTIYYTKHLLGSYFPQNNQDYFRALKQKGLYTTLYNTTTSNYLSHKPKNTTEITRNYRGFAISLYPHTPSLRIDTKTRFLTNWLEPQLMAKKYFSSPKVNTLEYATRALAKEKFWMVSIGGVASNYLYALLGSPMTSMTYQLLCHYPHPLKVGNPRLKAVFLFDDVYHAVQSQFNRGFQVPNIRKISNRNYNKVQLEIGLQEYAVKGIDLFELEKQFDAWTKPKNFDHAICCIKTSAVATNLDKLLDFLELSPLEKARIKKACKIRPFKKAAVPPKLRQLYGAFDAKIKAHPDIVIHRPNK